MSELNLKWWQAKIVREQLNTAEEGLALGHEGKITLDSGCVVQWDNLNVKLEIPDEELLIQNPNSTSAT